MIPFTVRVESEGRRKDRFAKMGTGGRHVRVGFFETARYAGDLERQPEALPVATVAMRNEFGVPGKVPERPFFRNAIKNAEGKMQRMIVRELDRERLTLDSRLVNRLGALVQGEVQRSITDLRSPPNSPATIAAKGSSNPLVDTGTMRTAVTWEEKHGEP